MRNLRHTQPPPDDVPAFAFWLMPDEDPLYEDFGYYATPLDNWQRGRCAMCQVESTPNPARALDLDHDHDTGMTRGLLCRGCNLREGWSDSPKFEAWRNGFNTATILGCSTIHKPAILGAIAGPPTSEAEQRAALEAAWAYLYPKH